MGTTGSEIHSTTPVEIFVAGVLFDMDGVLVSSTHGDERCWVRWASHHGLSETFDIRRTHGRRGADTVREYFPDLTPEGVAKHLYQLDLIAEEEQFDVSVYPGAIKLLASIPSHQWTIVTSASEKMMRSRLASVGIAAPKHTVGGDTIEKGKPHPEGYLRGAALLARQPEECLVIEDAPAGIRAGKAAGCRVLAVASSHHPKELQLADWIISSINLVEVFVDPESASLKLKFPALANETHE